MSKQVTVYFTKHGYESENTYDELASALYQSIQARTELVQRLNEVCVIEWNGGIPVAVIKQLVDKYGV